jgi:hypothetical protein
MSHETLIARKHVSKRRGRGLRRWAVSDESLSDKCNKPPILEFEGFILRPFDGWNLWLENSHGEGATITKLEFLGTIAKLFERNF